MPYRSSMFLLLIVVATVSLTACSPRLQVRFEDSHQVFVEKTIEGLELPEEMLSIIRDGGPVGLVSLETKETLDHPVVALVEDAIIEKLSGEDVQVAERDADMIDRFIAEGSADGYALPDPERVVTEIAPASFILAYRVLECGLQVRRAGTQKLRIREGRIRLHVRLHDARSGLVLASARVENTFEDTVKRKYLRELADFHYTFYANRLPLQDQD